MANELTNFHIVLYRPNEPKGTRIKVRDVRRLLYDEKNGRPLEIEEARKRVEALKPFIPLDWTLFIVEEQSSPVGELRFEATCSKHGLRINEFFCGLCGEKLLPDICG